MTYWDSSAIVRVLCAQQDPEGRPALLLKDGGVTTWWGSKVECAAALHRLRREKAFSEAELIQVLTKLETFFETCVEIEATEEVRKRAVRLLRTHPLRAGDAFQLAAALVASRESPDSLPFVGNDQRLNAAAAREGFLVL